MSVEYNSSFITSQFNTTSSSTRIISPDVLLFIQIVHLLFIPRLIPNNVFLQRSTNVGRPNTTTLTNRHQWE